MPSQEQNPVRRKKRIAILEFVAGGGMVAHPMHEIPTSLFQEGRAMLRALATDWASLQDWDVIVCWDARLGEFEVSNVDVRFVSTDDTFFDVWRELVTEVDYVIVIAPEIDRQLTAIIEGLQASDAVILNADLQFIEATSDKLLTSDCFQVANVRHPRTQCVTNFIQGRFNEEIDVTKCDAWTGRSAHPTKQVGNSGSTTVKDDDSGAWVIKPREGAGCQEVLRFNSLADVHHFIQDKSRADRDWSRYVIQPWIEGAAGSVAVLCGPGRICVLPAMSQNISLDANRLENEVSYCGGVGPFRTEIQSLIEAFAKQVIRSLPGCPVGWVGIDFVIDDSCSPEDSIVAIEVNPRLTTSYLGLRAIVSENLAGLIFEVALGNEIRFTMSGRSTTFDAFGMSVDK